MSMSESDKSTHLALIARTTSLIAAGDIVGAESVLSELADSDGDRALMVAGAEAHGEFLRRLDNPAQPSGSLLRRRSAKPTSAQAKVPR